MTLICKKMINKQSDVEDRRIVLRIKGKAFIPSHSVTSSITRICKSQFAGEWDTWTSIPQEEKDIWFNAFKAKYRWNKRIDGDVRFLFNFLGFKSFRDFMCKARTRHPTKKPPFLHLTAWHFVEGGNCPNLLQSQREGRLPAKLTSVCISVVPSQMSSIKEDCERN